MSKNIPPPLPKRPPSLGKASQTSVPVSKPDIFLILRFVTVSGYQRNPVEIVLKFDSNINYIPVNNGHTNLESKVFFHLIKRASDRLALNTDNEYLQSYKTELASISGGEINDNGTFNIKEVIPLDEIRQYTNTQKVKAVLKGGAAGLLATVGGTLDVIGAVAPIFLGAVAGSQIGGNIGGTSGALVGGYVGANVGSNYSTGTNVSGIANNVFQGILGDEYLTSADKKLFLGKKTYPSTDGKYIDADVPFSMTIHNLVFPSSLQSGETYTLFIEGMFLGVHVASNGYDVTHGDASNLYIKDAKILANSTNKKEVKKILASCKNNSECLYFENQI
jgi:hypothetical protein